MDNFFAQVFTIAAYSLWLITCLAVTWTEAPLVNYTGRWFCDASLIAVSIGLYIATWLRLAIAVFRLIYFSSALSHMTGPLEQWGPLVFSISAIAFGTITGTCVILI